MKRILLLLALGFGACEREADDRPAPSATAATNAADIVQTRSSKPPSVVPKPQDQAQLDRMILAGYTPHADHLHAPGVNECPLTKGTEAVM